ncbi:MAG: PEGA domain-containing protein [Myxococcota bacterium]
MRNKHLLSGFLALSLGGTPTAWGEPAPGIKEVDTTPKLAIMALSAQGVPEEYAASLTESIATEITRTGVFETISPRQVASILAYEKRKDALGACTTDDCYLAVARVVKAGFLIGGSLGKVGDQLVLNLILIGGDSGQALSRTKRETTNATELLEEAHRGAIVVLEPLLAKRRGYLKITANVPDAQVMVNDELRAEGVGQVISLSSGPHVVRVKKDGFYATGVDVVVQPDQVVERAITLVPAKETISAYETKATLFRVGGYASGALAIGAGVVAAIFYAKAGDNKEIVDRFADLKSIDQTAALRDRAKAARDDFTLDQGVYFGALGGALLFAGASTLFFLTGDDPDRYAEFSQGAK